MIGTSVGHYRVIARLSAGGMGVVYRAEHELLGKPAAIKVLHPELTTNRDIVNRFFTEAKATTSIRHVGIVEVFDFGYLESGHAYLVMELLEGEPLSAALRRGRMGQLAALALLRGVSSALIAAHAKGIVHRDLKPDNIFLVPDPDSPLGVRPKLLDFGIAKLTDVGMAGSATRTGAVMGTPTYMSPEQCKGTGEVDHRADLYSLGCVLYELVTGRPPFVSQGAGELIGAHLFVQPESPRVHTPELSPELEHLILSLLAKNPAERPASAVELVQRLDEVARASGGTPVHQTSPGGVGGLGAMLTPDGVGGTPPMGALGSSPGLLGPEALTMATPYSLRSQPPPAAGATPPPLGAPMPPPSGGSPAMPSGGYPVVRSGSAGWPPAAVSVMPHGQPKSSSRRWLVVIIGGLVVGGAVALAMIFGGGVAGDGQGSAAVDTPAVTAPASDAGVATTRVDAMTEGATEPEIDAKIEAKIDAAPVDAGAGKPAPPPVKPKTKPKAKPNSDAPILIEEDI